MSRELKGTVKEILGTAFSVGCQVDGQSPKEITKQIDDGEIESMSYNMSDLVMWWVS
jgi:large subunit ribosomal protein L12e